MRGNKTIRALANANLCVRANDYDALEYVLDMISPKNRHVYTGGYPAYVFPFRSGEAYITHEENNPLEVLDSIVIDSSALSSWLEGWNANAC